MFLCTGFGKLLREGRALSEDGTFPVDHVDGDDQDKRDADWI